jgi:hypothetical protein
MQTSRTHRAMRERRPSRRVSGVDITEVRVITNSNLPSYSSTVSHPPLHLPRSTLAKASRASASLARESEGDDTGC